MSSESILNANYSNYSKVEKKNYLDSVSTSVSSIKNDSVQINYLFEIAAEYYYLKDSKSSFKASRRIFDLSVKSKDSLSMGRSLYYMGDCYEEYQKDSAYFYYKESEKIFRFIKDDAKIAKAVFNKAHLLFTEGNYVESEVEVIKALQKLQHSKKYTFLYKCYYLQACNHIELEEFDNAVNYLNLAQENLRKAKETIEDSNTYKEYNELILIGFCNLYDKKKDYKNTILELEKIATDKLKNQNSTIYSIVLGNLAYANMKIGNYKEAQKKYIESIELAKRNNHIQGYLYKIINFGEYYLITGDTLKATKYFNEALPIARKLKSTSEIVKTLNFLTTSDAKNAAFYKNEYVRVNDSIVKRQRLNREKFTRIEYETHKVEDSNKVLSNENLILILGLVITVIVFLTLIIFRSRLARKKELFLIQQKEEADDELFSLIKEFQLGLIKAKEEEQNRISKELHDGVVNQIYAIRMVLEILNEKEDELTQQKRIHYIRDLNKVEVEIRNLSHELHSDSLLYDTNFIFLINSLVKSNNALKGTNFKAEIADTINWEDYSSVVKITIYRILQESFSNVNKYSNAINCNLVVHETDDCIEISIKDDGIGFNIDNNSDGIGLKNIRARSKQLNATLVIKSTINQGTEISLKIKK